MTSDVNPFEPWRPPPESEPPAREGDPFRQWPPPDEGPDPSEEDWYPRQPSPPRRVDTPLTRLPPDQMALVVFFP
jgi:hypothetical protein